MECSFRDTFGPNALKRCQDKLAKQYHVISILLAHIQANYKVYISIALIVSVLVLIWCVYCCAAGDPQFGLVSYLIIYCYQ